MDYYAAVDVYYRNESATPALVEFSDFSSCIISRTLIQQSETVAPYIPGKFYLRELPCILKILELAGSLIKEMYGNNRIPYILKLTDQLSKKMMGDKTLYLNKLNYLI